MSERDGLGRFGPGSGYEHKPASGRPANGLYEPFTAEWNREHKTTHGATRPDRVRPIAEALESSLLEAAPWCAADAFAGARASWAWLEAQASLLRAWLDEHGLLDGDGNPRPATRLLDRVETRLLTLRGQLGLTPASLAALLSKASSVARATADARALEALLSEGAAIMEARARRELEGGDG